MLHNTSNIVSSVLILCAIGLFFGYAKGEYSGITGATDFKDLSVQELKVKRAEFDDAFQKLREIEEVRSGLLTKFNSITQEEREKLVKAIPGHIDTVRLIIDVNTAASKYGMATGNIQLSAPSPATVDAPVEGTEVQRIQTAYSYMDLGFSVTGSYEDFLAFLSDLQDSLRIIDILEINLAPESSSEKTNETYTFSLKIRTYKLNE